jgi:hypothetical protein
MAQYFLWTLEAWLDYFRVFPDSIRRGISKRIYFVGARYTAQWWSAYLACTGPGFKPPHTRERERERERETDRERKREKEWVLGCMVLIGSHQEMWPTICLGFGGTKTDLRENQIPPWCKFLAAFHGMIFSSTVGRCLHDWIHHGWHNDFFH